MLSVLPCGLNNDPKWVRQFQATVKSYEPLLKAAEISLTISAILLSGTIAPEAALVRNVQAAEAGANVVEEVAVHGNSLQSLKPTWGYNLFSQDGTFLKNGITSAVKAESRYTRAFMSDKVMLEKTSFPNRAAAYE